MQWQDLFSLFHKESKHCKKILYKKCCWIFERCCCYSGALVNSSENGVCISKRGRPYELEGKLPKPGDLNLCNAFHDKTCWSASLATHGEASKDCLYFYDLLECSICHPDVGVQSERLRICASFCDRVFEACSDAYFSTSDASNQVKERLCFENLKSSREWFGSCLCVRL